MNTLVIFDSQQGRSEQIAHTIAFVLDKIHNVRVVDVNEESDVDLDNIHLLIIGSPTRRRKPSPAIQAFLNRIPEDALKHLLVASYDTRVLLPQWLTGSAARIVANKLQRKGGSLLIPPQSFFVAGPRKSLRDGEIQRAARWARMVHRMHIARQLLLARGGRRISYPTDRI